MSKIILKSLLILLCLSTYSCSIARAPLQNFNQALTSGHYQAAKKLTTSQITRLNSRQNLLWILQTASLERLMQNYTESNRYFDQAEEYFRQYDERLALGKTLQTSESILFNDSILPYVGKNHDRILVNTYKALNYAFLDDKQNARVEFNRALQRQNRAKSFFAAQTQYLKNQLAREKKELGSDVYVLDRSLNDPQLNSFLQRKYKNLDTLGIYKDFINPFTSYIAGLFFWLEGDTAKAVDLLKEAYAMNPGDSRIAADFRRAERGAMPDNELWIIFENGVASQRETTRFDLPLSIPQTRARYIGTAFPVLTPGKEAFPYLFFAQEPGQTIRTQTIANMDRILNTEFQKELPDIILREVARVVIKTYVQHEMRKEFGPIAGALSMLYQASTTAVDTRSWSALPKNFQLAHMNIPENRIVTMYNPSGLSIDINIPTSGRNMILYIRFVTAGTAPVYDFIVF